MRSFRVVGPGWGYPAVFCALTLPAIIATAQRPGGRPGAAAVFLGVAVLLYAWWRRGVWYDEDGYLVVVNVFERIVVPVRGTRLETKRVDRSGDWNEYDPDEPARVRALSLLVEDGRRVQVRVLDDSSKTRMRRGAEAVRVALTLPDR